MKTIEEKAKAYDEALKAAIAAHKDEDRHLKATLERIFPELQESEDERIRKGLIKALSSIGKRNWGGIDVFESISWLEKQKSVREIVERCKNSWYNEGKIDGMAEGLTNDEKYQQGWHDALEKQCQTFTKKDVDDAYVEGIASAKNELKKQGKSELKDNKDEKIRKKIIETFKNLGDGKIPVDINYADIFTWLEKQGESKSAGKMQVGEKLYEHIRNTCACIDDALSSETLADVKDYLSQANYDAQSAFDMIEKQGEQKPADKVEPKFHQGEWITNGDYTWKIIEVKPLDYILQSQDGNIVDDTISHVDEQFRSFTIEDAKDGDVLVAPPIKGQEGKEQIFIFKGINSRDYVDNCIEYYCRVYEGVFYENENENGYMGTTSSPLYPATKEQCDTLIKAMTDAGYTFDFEKKELKKISQRMVSAEAKEALYDKPAWGEEDENTIKVLMNIIRKSEVIDSIIYTDSLKEKLYDWLNSLKYRYIWKPSDDQMKALAWALSIAKNCGEECAFDIRKVCEQLEKLKG